MESRLVKPSLVKPMWLPSCERPSHIQGHVGANGILLRGGQMGACPQGEVRRSCSNPVAERQGRGRYIALYFGPLPPSRGVQRGPKTSVALQSMQFGAFTRSAPSASS